MTAHELLLHVAVAAEAAPSHNGGLRRRSSVPVAPKTARITYRLGPAAQQ